MVNESTISVNSSSQVFLRLKVAYSMDFGQRVQDTSLGLA